MEITHAKVSGEPNPTDPTKIGGDDWDAPHVLAGFKLLGSFRVDRDSSLVVTLTNVVGIATPVVTGNGAGSLSFSIPEISTSSWLNRIVIQVPDRYNRSLQRLQVFETLGIGDPPGFTLKLYLINTADNSSNSFGTAFHAVVNIYEVV